MSFASALRRAYIKAEYLRPFLKTHSTDDCLAIGDMFDLGWEMAEREEAREFAEFCDMVSAKNWKY